MRGSRAGLGAVFVAALCPVFPLEAWAANEIAREPYRLERLRHEEIRGRAEALSRNPLMLRFDLRAAEARIDDDREMKRFDLRAGTAAGSALTAPALKVYDDSLERTLDRMLEYVRH